MNRPAATKLTPLCISIAFALATLIGSLCIEVLTFRVIFTESGLYLEGIFDDIKTTMVQIDSPRGRFWALPGASYSWPMIAIAVPHWLTIVLALAWMVIPSRRKTGEGRHCAECGYNLTGNESGKCPECGATMPMPNDPQPSES